MTKEEAVVELLKPMMEHIVRQYHIADEPEKAADKIARFVMVFKEKVEPAFEAPQ